MQHVPSAFQILDDRIQGLLGILELTKVALQAAIQAGNDCQNAIQCSRRQAMACRVEPFHAPTQIGQCLGNRPTFVALVGQLTQRCLQHGAAMGSLLLQFKAHLIHGTALANY